MDFEKLRVIRKVRIKVVFKVKVIWGWLFMRYEYEH